MAWTNTDKKLKTRQNRLSEYMTKKRSDEHAYGNNIMAIYEGVNC